MTENIYQPRPQEPEPTGPGSRVALLARIANLEGQLAAVKTGLLDPAMVYANMLRGTIATPSHYAALEAKLAAAERRAEEAEAHEYETVSAMAVEVRDAEKKARDLSALLQSLCDAIDKETDTGEPHAVAAMFACAAAYEKLRAEREEPKP